MVSCIGDRNTEHAPTLYTIQNSRASQGQPATLSSSRASPTSRPGTMLAIAWATLIARMNWTVVLVMMVIWIGKMDLFKGILLYFGKLDLPAHVPSE